MTRPRSVLLLAALLVAIRAVSAQGPTPDAAFKQFWDANTPQDATKIASAVVASVS